MRTFHMVLNFLATLCVIALGLVTYGWPQKLGALHMGLLEAQMVMMQLVSLLLLMAFLQKNLGLPWRLFGLGGSFLVLSECVLMSGILFR